MAHAQLATAVLSHASPRGELMVSSVESTSSLTTRHAMYKFFL